MNVQFELSEYAHILFLQLSNPSTPKSTPPISPFSTPSPSLPLTVSEKALSADRERGGKIDMQSAKPLTSPPNLDIRSHHIYTRLRASTPPLSHIPWLLPGFFHPCRERVGISGIQGELKNRPLSTFYAFVYGGPVANSQHIRAPHSHLWVNHK